MSGQPPPQRQVPQQRPENQPRIWQASVMPKPWKTERDDVLIFVTVVLTLAIISGILFYGMQQNCACEGPTTRPVITFSQLMGDCYQACWRSWSVAGASEPISPFASYKVQLQMDGSPLVTAVQSLAADTNISFGTVTLIVHDLAGEGKLTSADSFHVYGMTIGHYWKFSLYLSADGSEIASASWSTP